MRVSKIVLAADISMNTFFVSCQTATWRNKVFIAIISYQAATNTCNFFLKNHLFVHMSAAYYWHYFVTSYFVIIL